jgi:hypothetical protein
MASSFVFASRKYMSNAHVRVLAFAAGAPSWPSLAKPLKQNGEFPGNPARPKR